MFKYKSDFLMDILFMFICSALTAAIIAGLILLLVHNPLAGLLASIGVVVFCAAVRREIDDN